MTDQNQTAILYTVVYDVCGDRQKHDEWWRMIHRLPDGISIKASASFDALAKLDELEGEMNMVSNDTPNQTADWRESDPGYYEMIVSEARNAKANNQSRDACPYPGGSIERAYWMDGYDD